jgi:putative ABC transport system permease protein
VRSFSKASSMRPLLANTIELARQTALGDSLRFWLTCIGVALGTAALMLVATFCLAGKHYVLSEIRAVGSNWICAEHQVTGGRSTAWNDNLTLDDLQAVRRNVSGIAAASPVLLPLIEHVDIGGGILRAIQVMGVSPDYKKVRNLSVVGRFFDDTDSGARNKVGVMNEQLARQLYGPPENALGRRIQLNGLHFVIIGSFSERVDTFGQTEVSDRTLLVPYTTSRYLQDHPMVKQILFSAADASLVAPVTAEVRRIIQLRHRSGAVYEVRNLAQLLAVAERTANALTILMLAVAFVILVVSGIGIMNMMLDRVREGVHDIGIRRACGATRRDIASEFLWHAIIISLLGGAGGLAAGLAIPELIRLFTRYYIPISGLAAGLGLVACSAVGVLAGTRPALHAARLDPAESIRYE